MPHFIFEPSFLTDIKWLSPISYWQNCSSKRDLHYVYSYVRGKLHNRTPNKGQLRKIGIRLWGWSCFSCTLSARQKANGGVGIRYWNRIYALWVRLFSDFSQDTRKFSQCTNRYDQGVMSALLTAKQVFTGLKFQIYRSLIAHSQFERVFPQVIVESAHPNHATLQSLLVAIYVGISQLNPSSYPISSDRKSDV
jgi:hypothetical protein